MPAAVIINFSENWMLHLPPLLLVVIVVVCVVNSLPPTHTPDASTNARSPACLPALIQLASFDSHLAFSVICFIVECLYIA